MEEIRIFYVRNKPSAVIRDMHFKIRFKCCICLHKVEPDRLYIGRKHVYALHCKTMQEIALVL